MKNSNSEKHLILRAQDGDDQAFEKLVTMHEQSVMSLALYVMGNVQDAQDVFQEAFIRVYHHLSTFRFESQFNTWLHRIVMNCAFNIKRKEKRFLSLVRSTQDESYVWDIADDDNQQPDALLIRQEVWQVIEKNLPKLSMMERVVFVLRYRQEFKLKEIAEITESSLGTVKNYLFRGTQKMKQSLKSYVKAES